MCASPTSTKRPSDPEADYFYITTNNTIYGTKFAALPETGKVPLVADMSSNILSEPYDVGKFGLIFAGAQKNIGPAGFALTIVRRDLIGRAMAITPKVLDYKKLDDAGSMLNTPADLCHLHGRPLSEVAEKTGGVEGIAEVNREKASWLYDFIDNSRIFKGVAEKESRSIMNVTFRTGDEDLDAEFVKAASQGRPCQHQGAPLRGRHARQHLQRHAPGGRQGAGGVHEEI